MSRANHVGLIALGPRLTGEQFDEEDRDGLHLMAGQAALALQTALQIQTLQRIPLQVEQAQLDERERIAQDLHDTTQAQLTQLNFALERVRRQLPEPAAAERLLDGCIQDVNGAARELRGILRALMPSRLADRSPLAALRDEAVLAQSRFPNVRILVETDEEVTAVLSLDQQETLWRVGQQALENALQHSEAATISLYIAHDPQTRQVQFCVQDNGVGFAPQSLDNLAAQGHFGLYIMVARLERIGGTLQVTSEIGEGTAVSGILSLSPDKPTKEQL